jgi:phosphoribosyl 1,2-cyclic phosphodiesterase
MRVTLFGTRGSLAAPGAETNHYGGNTSTVEVCANDGTLLVLDAGTGIRRLAKQMPLATTRIDILLTHLHMDHIQGLGFLVRSMTRMLMFTFGGQPAVCSDSRLGFRDTYLRPCFRCTFVTCLRLSVMRYHVPHLP